jgi:hypothetical protein
MTDTTAGETSAEPVPPVPPAPEAPAELDAVPPQADTPAEQVAERALPFEIAHAIGATRQAILDHFLDTEGDQSMAQIKAALPSVLPGTIEACVRRELLAGRLLKVSPGVYKLAPVSPPEAKPAPPPEPGLSKELSDDGWLAAMDAWFVDRSTWDREKLGPLLERARRDPARR